MPLELHCLIRKAAAQNHISSHLGEKVCSMLMLSVEIKVLGLFRALYFAQFLELFHHLPRQLKDREGYFGGRNGWLGAHARTKAYEGII